MGTGNKRVTAVVKSKITIKEIITLIIGFLAIWGFIPVEFKEKVMETVIIASPIVGIIFRQWFTITTIQWDEE